ncbi:FAD-binding oxidoreductase [Dactylosporangium sp. CA-092794]|uniref:FAD-binding oxidoreductase n=1 Tax=Dactylosporangium sp. CA-092794 TaxID=3239929 RepID=UPI003D8EC2ED
MDNVAERFADIVGRTNLLVGEMIPEDYAHDEALTAVPQPPAYLARPGTAEEVAALLLCASEHSVPVTARGSATGLSGAARPCPDGLVISFERMNAVLEIDTDNHVAVVQPGVTLSDLDEQTAAAGLSYTVYPGELSATVGGNVGTNAGGMRAVKYGVTRHNVLGLQAALPSGELIRTGGRISKISSGYDLTQLIIGSEGSLAIATEVIVKLHPRLPYGATVLAPFGTVEEGLRVVPKIIASGLGPHIVEYIDDRTLAAISDFIKLDLGIPETVRDTAAAYLMVALESRDKERLEADVEELAGLILDGGAMDGYVLDGAAARMLVEAREKSFWTAKAVGVDDIIDVVVPRNEMPRFLRRTQDLALAVGATVVGCGHAGDGNVHLGLFCPDAGKRKQLLTEIFAVGMELGGAISGEHGIGKTRSEYYLELEDPAKIALLRRIKASFDPAGILNPGILPADEG